VQVHDGTAAGHTNAFLKGRQVHAMLRASQYLAIIKHLDEEHLLDIPIPKLPAAVTKAAGDRIGECFRLRDEGVGLIRRGNERFAEAIGRPVPKPPTEIGYSIPVTSLGIGNRRAGRVLPQPAGGGGAVCDPGFRVPACAVRDGDRKGVRPKSYQTRADPRWRAAHRERGAD
jgi:hypothetical protein